jgi:hypothetical protein
LLDIKLDINTNCDSVKIITTEQLFKENRLYLKNLDTLVEIKAEVFEGDLNFENALNEYHFVYGSPQFMCNFATNHNLNLKLFYKDSSIILRREFIDKDDNAKYFKSLQQSITTLKETNYAFIIKR